MGTKKGHSTCSIPVIHRITYLRLKNSSKGELWFLNDPRFKSSVYYSTDSASNERRAS